MYQEMFKEIKHLNSQELTNLEQTNLKLDQMKKFQELLKISWKIVCGKEC